ncbi:MULTISPECIES: tRNA (adenosine(37)-N6)-dimethylallyltransferase MiaA [unclassified Lactococcus]|uniref:tRNA (adenosine(37)-N6)-dimethylallyltransferase MiaA n=1 Tax=unclassified Lactococcus TaxID=2643510 RepID=UPI0011CB363A|nr:MULTISPECIES: tRNA (adenosine(37)-N6)-dimethylallyltransferase MiaA [unclassified Lactococcus]MQW22410.1 tRNA (adenosine(37)-N6)-dimethylallyltransferase MiaA [Lactococcus sp. dk101]TXK45443.1 tRNA (adenosine(37)-N6)-dimethylallyltransferase MiaA [Lactococcus sp. dk310]TXK51776.1 tRNA (adenosine(37)-N6)-dimethylallyltransferase MiaA [Lactococcus sp. dk322]
MKNKVIVVVGPTAVGKTALGIELCQHFNGEVISGDSQQVYCQLNIGTAKATAEEQAAAVHHLIDVRQLTENFSAFDFVNEANRLIEQLLTDGKVPVIVGGTGLYLQSLIEGYHLGGQENHEAMMDLRESLSALTDDVLFQKVSEQGIKIEEINRRRAIRALELAEFGSGENQSSNYDFHLIGLNAPRELLYERINARVDLMMRNGLLDEAKMLFDQFPDVQAAKGIGYKEFFPYFRQEITLEEAVELVKRNSRRYAKRQITWFKNRMSVDFVDVFSTEQMEKMRSEVQLFLEEK